MTPSVKREAEEGKEIFRLPSTASRLTKFTPVAPVGQGVSSNIPTILIFLQVLAKLEIGVRNLFEFWSGMRIEF